MPVPSSITDLSTNPTANSPQGSESAKGTVDDYFRAHGSFIAQLNALVGGGTVSVASAGTVALGAAGSINVSITGTSTIYGFDNFTEGAQRRVTFAGALTLVHNSTSMQLPGWANIMTAAGDIALFKSLGNGNWKCLSYTRVNGAGVIPCLPLAGGVMTGQLLALQGTAALPGISFANEGGADTGFYQASEGTVAATCNGGAVQTWSPTAVTMFRQLIVDTAAQGGNYTSAIIRNPNGLQIALQGSGPNPYKTLRIFNGVLSIVNSAYTAQIFSLDDAGNLAVSGTATATVVTQTSDERKKKRWQRLPGDFITKLAGIRKSGLFQWKKGGAGLGVGAQSLEQILPLAVHTDDAGAKTVNYGAFAGVAVVELARAVVDLQARVAQLEAR